MCWNERRLAGLLQDISCVIRPIDIIVAFQSNCPGWAALFFLPHNHYLPRIWWTSWTISVGAAGCACRCEMAPYSVAVLWPAVQSMDLMAAWTQQAVPDPMPRVQQMAEDTVSRTARCGGVLQMSLGRTHFLLSPALFGTFGQRRELLAKCLWYPNRLTDANRGSGAGRKAECVSTWMFLCLIFARSEVEDRSKTVPKTLMYLML